MFSFYIVNGDCFITKGKCFHMYIWNCCITDVVSLKASWMALQAIHLLYCLLPKCCIVTGPKIKCQYSLFHTLLTYKNQSHLLCFQNLVWLRSMPVINLLSHQQGRTNYLKFIAITLLRYTIRRLYIYMHHALTKAISIYLASQGFQVGLQTRTLTQEKVNKV